MSEAQSITSPLPRRVLVLQHRLLHYRIALFEQLREKCLSIGVHLDLVVGQASPSEEARKDEAYIPWAIRVRNRFLTVRGRDLLWQPVPVKPSDYDLIILMQESRIISNYPILARRWLFGGAGKVAYWGHGKNFQSSAPSGIRERWKRLLVSRVDWWFAYSASTVRLVRNSGFSEDCITCLNNAINGQGFISDLESIATDELAAARQLLRINLNSQVAIYCGSIYAEKRIGLLLDAADLLRARLPDFHLIVVGDGPEAPAVRRAAATRPWLHVRGVRKGRDKALDYRLASVMLNPGLVGLHIVDAFAASTPLFTQASAMHSPEYDYLVDGVNGRSVTDDSAQSYADAVAQAFVVPGLLASMQAQCAVDAQRYTLEHMVTNFADGIAACLKTGSRR